MAVASFVQLAAIALGSVIWYTAQQAIVPNTLLGRVSALDWVVTMSFIPLSYALTAPLSELIGPRATLTTCGLVGSVLILLVLLVPGVASRKTEQQIVAAAKSA
jgi:hypothetical protein